MVHDLRVAIGSTQNSAVLRAESPPLKVFYFDERKENLKWFQLVPDPTSIDEQVNCCMICQKIGIQKIQNCLFNTCYCYKARWDNVLNVII